MLGHASGGEAGERGGLQMSDGYLTSLFLSWHTYSVRLVTTIPAYGVVMKIRWVHVRAIDEFQDGPKFSPCGQTCPPNPTP